MKNKIVFPESFESRVHPIGLGGMQYCYPSIENCKVSVVFGHKFFSNGVDTFEMFDFREEDPRGYLTIEEINEYINNNPV